MYTKNYGRKNRYIFLAQLTRKQVQNISVKENGHKSMRRTLGHTVRLKLYIEKTMFPFLFTLNGTFLLFISILNQMEFHLVQNRKEKCHYDHIQFNVKGNGDIVFSV